MSAWVSSTDLTAPKSNFRFTPESGLKSDIRPCPKSAIDRHIRPQINPAGAKPGPDDTLGGFFPIASPRDPAAHARLLALRGAETNVRVRKLSPFSFESIGTFSSPDRLLAAAVAVAAIQPRRKLG